MKMTGQLRLLVSMVLVVLLLSSCALASGGPRAQVEPSCVEPGASATLTVRTDPGAFVMYLARYADGRNGAPEPMGAGYGGNEGGRADEDGLYSHSWTVSPDAPAGSATVEIIIPEAGHGGAGASEHPEHVVEEMEAEFRVSGRSGEGC